MSALQTVSSANKLVDDIAPKLKARNSGYFRIERTSLRRGDLAQMAKVSFVDDLSKPAEAKKAEAAPKPAAKPKTTVKKAGAK